MVVERNIRRYGAAWSGLISGPTAWAISTQLNYALVPWQCGNHAYPIPWIALLLTAGALAGTVLSLRTWRSAPCEENSISFAAAISTLAGIIFAAVILLQGLAALIFTGCER